MDRSTFAAAPYRPCRQAGRRRAASRPDPADVARALAVREPSRAEATALVEYALPPYGHSVRRLADAMAERLDPACAPAKVTLYRAMRARDPRPLSVPHALGLRVFCALAAADEPGPLGAAARRLLADPTATLTYCALP